MSNQRARPRTQARSSGSRSGPGRETVLIVVIGAVALLVAGTVLFLLRGQGTGTAAPGGTAESTTLVRPDSPARGPAGAPVVLVEFLDPECPACAAVKPAVDQVLARYPDDVRLVVRYFPVNPNARFAMAAAEAAREQGKYWEMLGLLLDRQREWSPSQGPPVTQVNGFARELGLDLGRFQADLNRMAVQERIDRDLRDGQSLGVRGTPTFFINGQQVTNLTSAAQLLQAVDAAVAQARAR